MKPVLFSIGSLNIYSYGLMIALGVAAAIGLACFRTKKFYGLNADHMFTGGIIGIIAGIIGAKLMYWIVVIKDIIADPSILLDFGGGFVVYGGVVLGVLAPVLYLKLVKKIRILPYVDIAVAGIALGQAFGRIGCLLAGCCYGAEAPVGAWYAIVFPEVAEAPHGVGLYPTQIMSSLGDLLLCGGLVLYTHWECFCGETTTFYMIFYAIGRFFIEYLRNDDRGWVGPFSTSQFISIIMFAAGVALWIFLRIKNYPPLRLVKKGGKETPEDNAPAPEEAQ